MIAAASRNVAIQLVAEPLEVIGGPRRGDLLVPHQVLDLPGGVELLGLTRNEAAVTTGRWHALTRMTKDWTCVPQIFDPGRTDLVSGQLPTCGMIVT